MRRPLHEISEEAQQEASEWMNRINSDKNIPGLMISYSKHAYAVVYVTPDLHEAIFSGSLGADGFPKQFGEYPVHYAVLPGPPYRSARSKMLMSCSKS